METTQLAMISTSDTLELPKMPTMGLELSTAQFQTRQQANGQFCHISTPFQPLANPPTCIVALYAKSKASMSGYLPLQLQPRQHNNPDMPRETYGNNHYPTTNTHTETTYGLQCHFSSFLPTPRYETRV